MTAIQPALARHWARLERSERACRYPAEGESGAGRRGHERGFYVDGAEPRRVALNPSPRATEWRVVLPAGSFAAAMTGITRHEIQVQNVYGL
jgi:hypothetical protein